MFFKLISIFTVFFSFYSIAVADDQSVILDLAPMCIQGDISEPRNETLTRCQEMVEALSSMATDQVSVMAKCVRVGFDYPRCYSNGSWFTAYDVVTKLIIAK